MSESIARSRCSGSGQSATTSCDRDRLGRGIPQRLEDRAARLPVAALVSRLTAAFVAGVGVPRRAPCAQVCDRAGEALRGAGGAGRRAELHGCRVHDPRGLRIGGQHLLHRREIPSGRRPRLRAAVDRAGEHAAGVRVDDRMPVAVGEHRHGARRVVADAGQGEERVHVARHDPVVPVADLDGRPVQPQRAPRVAEVRPLPDRLRRGVCRERRRGRPAVQPRFEVGDHAVHRRLLEHELAHQHTPRIEARAAPGQIACAAAVPGDQRGREIGHAVQPRAVDRRSPRSPALGRPAVLEPGSAR